MCQAKERFEDPLLLFGWNSGAIVAHFHPDLVLQLTGGQLNPATRWCELDRVASKIHEHLLKSHSVGVNMQITLDLLE